MLRSAVQIREVALFLYIFADLNRKGVQGKGLSPAILVTGIDIRKGSSLPETSGGSASGL